MFFKMNDNYNFVWIYNHCKYQKIIEHINWLQANVMQQNTYMLFLKYVVSFLFQSESGETVITHRSWDEPNNQEALELQDLPDSISPEPAWRRGDSVVLDVDSPTDTESELDESSSQESFHNTNWELEMLAAQMRQQRRSASFDQTSSYRPPHTPTARRRLCRGYSAEGGRPRD